MFFGQYNQYFHCFPDTHHETSPEDMYPPQSAQIWTSDKIFICYRNCFRENNIIVRSLVLIFISELEENQNTKLNRHCLDITCDNFDAIYLNLTSKTE